MARVPHHESFVLINRAFNGGMINLAETAVAIASAILKDHFGAEEVSKQQPLHVFDDGDSWLVKGSYRDPGLDIEDGGAWYIRLMKDDGRVVDAGHRLVDLQPSDRARQLIQRRGSSPQKNR